MICFSEMGLSSVIAFLEFVSVEQSTEAKAGLILGLDQHSSKLSVQMTVSLGVNPNGVALPKYPAIHLWVGAGITDQLSDIYVDFFPKEISGRQFWEPKISMVPVGAMHCVDSESFTGEKDP